MARTPRIDWEAYKEQLIELRKTKTLSEIAAVLQEKVGTTVTPARLSQLFTQWRKDGGGGIITNIQQEVVNAN